MNQEFSILSVCNAELKEPASTSTARLDAFGHVDLQLTVTADYTGDLTKIATLDAAYRPAVRKMIIGKANTKSGAIPATFYIDWNGEVSVYTGTLAETGILFALGGGYSVK